MPGFDVVPRVYGAARGARRVSAAIAPRIGGAGAHPLFAASRPNPTTLFLPTRANVKHVQRPHTVAAVLMIKI